ncbi:Putative ADP,ATP carrier protein [Rhizopus microsporus]|nr:Putative ADP,ATP carrier protein [Rhizopus microsporus]
MLRHLQRGACVKFNTFIRPKLVIPSNGLYKQSVFSQLHTTISNPVKVHSASVVNGLGITEKAVKQLQHIQEKEQDKEQMLRILVDSGGCHGYQNKLELTKTVEDDDIIFEKEGVKVVIDSVSFQFLRGSTLDYVQELVGSTFQVTNNPNAKHSCGCNISYDIDLDKIQ